MATNQAGFLIDIERCCGCNACEIACRDRHDVQEGRGRLEIRDYEGAEDGRPYLYHLPFTCFHCAEASCVAACPEEALAKRAEDGIVLLNKYRCTGCLVCLDICPFGALVADLKQGKVDKCDYCVEDPEGPACVLACPYEALVAGKLAELEGREGAIKAVRGFPDDGRAGPAIVFVPVAPAAVATK